MNLSSYIKRFFSGTLLSRISGMLRDLAMAFAFGDHPSVAAFMVAFRFSNLFRRLLGEGPLQSAFIPQFEGLRLKDPIKANLFFQKLTAFISILLLILIAASELSLWSLETFWHFSVNSQEILTLTKWMLPGLLFICLYGLNISLLNCHDSFFIPSFAPFISNLIWIIGALFLKNHEPSSAMLMLSKLIVIGFLGQWLVTLPLTLKYSSFRFKQLLSWSIPPEVKILAKSFTFGAIGVGAMQINALADSLFARYVNLNGPIYLWYSIRLEQLALAIFGIACVSTIVPRLSRAIKSSDLENAKFYFFFSFRRILAVMIPCSFAIFSLGISSVNLLFGHGHFSAIAVQETTFCLWAYTLGLVPATMVILFSSLFYAKDDFKTPTRFSLISILFNLILNALFVFGMGLGAISTALATSFASWLNFWLLQKAAKKAEWHVAYAPSKSLQLILASCFGLVSAFLSALLLLDQPMTILPTNTIDQMIHFLVPFVFFVLGILAYSYSFKNQDLLELFAEVSFFRRKKTTPEKS